jgi:hypothetical protein
MGNEQQEKNRFDAREKEREGDFKRAYYTEERIRYFY